MGGRQAAHSTCWIEAPGQITDSTHSFNFDFGRAPILVAATWPSLKRMRVGMPRTPYFIGVCGFSSMLSLAIDTLPSSSVASSSSAGAIILQGEHHSAQKSTSTGLDDRRTSVSNVPSVTLVGFMKNSSRDNARQPASPHPKG